MQRSTSLRRSICRLLPLAWVAFAPALAAQPRPYIGYAYPAGGQQGTTVTLRLGGQNLDGVQAARLTGAGLTARVIEYHRRLNNQEVRLLREQLKALQSATAPAAAADASSMMSAAEPGRMMRSDSDPGASAGESRTDRVARIQERTQEFVATPACAALASLALIEVTIAADAEPGERELRLITPKGISNPVPFHVGQLPEVIRKPLPVTTKQVLGKEEQALRQRLAEEIESRVTVPCTLNGQVASGEVNRYRFAGRKGQRLVMAVHARRLVPFIADAVPGWFQPVLRLCDAQGREVAYADDYRFHPDPVLLFEVPHAGEYVLAVTDALHRGREDFLYRISLGELPFVSSVFPLGRRAGTVLTPELDGWNLDGSRLMLPPADAGPGVHAVAAIRKGLVSHPVPFAIAALPAALEQETNDLPSAAQPVSLPIVIDGRIGFPGDVDCFQFVGKSNAMVVAEVMARRLDSPLDAVLQLADANGGILAFSDDREDLGAGMETHHADPGFRVRLPADGTYRVQIRDVARAGGAEYGYRLRLSAPQPDFALRVVPSSVALRARSSAVVSVYVIRQDGFSGPIKLALKDSPPGFSAAPVTVSGTQTVARLTIKTSRTATEEPVSLVVAGSARIGGSDITREAVPAEDRMQAFLWRHLLPARDFLAWVHDPAYRSPPRRPLPPPSSSLAVADTNAAAKPKFSQQQVAARLRQLRSLYEEGLLTAEFYQAKVAECEAVP